MTLPFALGVVPLPDWLPAWIPAVLMVAALLWLLLLLAMPFAVLGTRSRLEAIEAQLDDLHAELRTIAMLLGSGPPPRALTEREDMPRPAGRDRAEPRLGWSAPPASGDWSRRAED